MSRYNVLLSGYSIVDEIINRDSSTAAKIGHDYIVGTSYEIWTGAGKTGTKLTLNTDYTLNNKNDYYSGATLANTNIYTKVAIINGTYQNRTLYQTYTTIGDMLSIENAMEVTVGTQVVITGNYTLKPGERRVIVNTASAVTITIPTTFDLYDTIEVSRIVASTNAVTLARSGSETINGTTSFVTHGAEASSTRSNNIIKIQKTGSSSWIWVDGIISGSSSYTGGVKSWEKRHTGYSTYKYRGNLPSGGSINVSHGLTPSKIIGMYGSFYYSSSSRVLAFGHIAEDGARTAQVVAVVENTNIQIICSNALAGGYYGSPFTITIEYKE